MIWEGKDAFPDFVVPFAHFQHDQQGNALRRPRKVGKWTNARIAANIFSVPSSVIKHLKL
jgi:hypothetical protein